MLNGNAHVLTRLVIELRRKGCTLKMTTTLNGEPIDECFGTTLTHIKNIPVYDCTTVKATSRHTRRRNSRVKLSYDIDRLVERMRENV